MSAAWSGRLGATLPWIARQPRSKTRLAAGVVWLAFIVFPLADAIGHPGSELGHLLAIAGAALFVVLYVGMVLMSFGARRPGLGGMLVAVLIADAVVLTLVDRPGWAFLFTYCAASAVLVVPPSITFQAVVGCAALSIGCSLVNDSGSTAIGAGATTLGVGLVMVLLRDLQVRNQELREARAELASAAVAAERERFARDLHDLLGHSLSVIAIKAELAGRLLPGQPEQAASEIADVEGVARQALGEVREAVSGYRQPTLASEMEGARVALAAAGIIAEFQDSPITLAPEVEAVLAWAVREGATNVIRHSGARRCQVRVRAARDDAAVEVVDDGDGYSSGDGGRFGARAGGAGFGARAGGAGASVTAGHGLAGLGERAHGLRGWIEAGGLPSGGFRLAVSVPVSEAPS